MRDRFGRLFRAKRKEAQKTMGDVARFLGVTVPYVSDVELGKRMPWSPDKILALSEYLNTPGAPLIEAALLSRGEVSLPIGHNGVQAETGNVLMRTWNDLTEDQLREIAEIANKAASVKKGGG